MTRRLRIVSVCRALPTPTDPAAGVFVFNRLAAMHERADVTIIQPVPYAPAVKPLPSWARSPNRVLRGISIRHAPMLYIPGILKTLDAHWLERAIAPQIEALHRAAPIDALDAHFGFPDGAGCVRLAARLNVPAFITMRGFEHDYVLRLGIARQMLQGFRQARGCISVSHSLRDRVAQFGVDPEQIEVIHNAIDSHTFRRGERASARDSLRLGSEPLVVCVGNLVSGKRHHVLLDAFAELRREIPDATLAIVGGARFEPRYPHELVAQAQRLGISGAVRFAGNIAPERVALWLQAADVFALATAREGCCNAVLEALAAGLPVITTPAGDNAYFVKDDVNGYIVPVDDRALLSRRIGQALGREWDRDDISRRLKAEVGSWDGVAARVLEYMAIRIGGAAPALSRAVHE